MRMSNKSLHLGNLKDILNFSEAQCICYAEYCAVALEHWDNNPGVLLVVTGELDCEFSLHWESPSQRDGYQDPYDFWQYGAIAISCFLVKELTHYTRIIQSPRGGGYDYFLGFHLGDENYDPLNPWHARIEISGIGRETRSNTVGYRYSKKVNRKTLRRAVSMSTYISIVEFESPKAHFSKCI